MSNVGYINLFSLFIYFIHNSIVINSKSIKAQKISFQGFYIGMLTIGLWKKLKQKMDKRAIQQALNIGHEKWKHS